MLRLSILPLLLGGVAGVLGYRMNTPGANSIPAAPADLVIYGRVWTGDSAKPWAQAVAISGEKIAAVGDSRASRPGGAGTRVIRNGAMVVPGFMDGHTHFIYGGFQLASVDLRTPTVRGVRRAGSRRTPPSAKPGEWILGGDWDHERWPGTPLRTGAGSIR